MKRLGKVLKVFSCQGSVSKKGLLSLSLLVFYSMSIKKHSIKSVKNCE